LPLARGSLIALSCTRHNKNLHEHTPCDYCWLFLSGTTVHGALHILGKRS
jgi:hypothetical protein